MQKHFLVNSMQFNKMINVGNHCYCLILSKIGGGVVAGFPKLAVHTIWIESLNLMTK